MPALKIHLNGDACWPDLAGKNPPVSQDLEITSLARGTVSGAPSVMIRVNLPNGGVVLAETTFKLLVGAVRVFAAKHGISQ
jgi:hypothetical protein